MYRREWKPRSQSVLGIAARAKNKTLSLLIRTLVRNLIFLVMSREVWRATNLLLRFSRMGTLDFSSLDVTRFECHICLKGFLRIKPKGSEVVKDSLQSQGSVSRFKRTSRSNVYDSASISTDGAYFCEIFVQSPSSCPSNLRNCTSIWGSNLLCGL